MLLLLNVTWNSLLPTFMANPIFGVALALEEERANGAEIDDAAISGVKVGMMGPLQVPVTLSFWFSSSSNLPFTRAKFGSFVMSLGPIVFSLLNVGCRR